VQAVPKTSTGGAKALFFIGLILVLVSTAGGIGGIIMTKSGWDSASQLSQIEADIDTQAMQTIMPGVPSTAQLQADTTYALWLGDVQSNNVRTPVVTGPDGPVTVSSQNYTIGEAKLYGWTFKTRAAGTYEISTSSDSGPVELMPNTAMDQLMSGVTGAFTAIGGVALIGVTLVLGFIGLCLWIPGWIWWASRAKKKRLVAAGRA